MAEVTWFKVLTDIFGDDKIKIIQSMPEGDSLLVMWFKVLSQAGKTNDGGYIYLKKNIPYNFGMFATLFGKQQQLVELAMRTFSEFGMIDIDDKGYVFVTNWEKHQSVDKLDRIREKTKLRVQNHRENKRLELQISNVTVTQDVTQGNATEIDVDIELDKEIDKRYKDEPQVTITTIHNAYRLYESEKFGLLSSTIGEKIGHMIDDYSELWVCKAMEEAVYYGKRFLPYVKKVLVDWETLNHPEPWTLEKPEQPQGKVHQLNQRRGGYQQQPQKAKLPVANGKTNVTMTPEELEHVRSFGRGLSDKGFDAS